MAQITGEAFKVKIVEAGNEAIVIKLSDPEAGAPLQEGAPATAVEEACSRSGPSSCNEVHQRMPEKSHTEGMHAIPPSEWTFSAALVLLAEMHALQLAIFEFSRGEPLRPV